MREQNFFLLFSCNYVYERFKNNDVKYFDFDDFYVCKFAIMNVLSFLYSIQLLINWLTLVMIPDPGPLIENLCAITTEGSVHLLERLYLVKPS